MGGSPAETDSRLGDGGFSLIETLAAAVIFSMVGAAIIAGVAVVVRADTGQQARSAATVASQNYADLLFASPYTDCASGSAYAPSALGLPNQDRATVIVDSVRFWTGQPLPTVETPTAAQWETAFGNSCSGDRGLQRVTYTVTAQVGDTTASKTVSVLKRVLRV